MFAMRPPAATIAWQISNVAGTVVIRTTASVATLTAGSGLFSHER